MNRTVLNYALSLLQLTLGLSILHYGTSLAPDMVWPTTDREWLAATALFTSLGLFATGLLTFMFAERNV